MKPIKVVGALIVKNKKVLAEVRKSNDDFGPSRTWVPGGHIEKNESPKKAMIREMEEEFDIIPKKYFYYCRLPWEHKNKDYEVHYFVCTKWKGKIKNKEASKLIWIGSKNIKKFSEEIDRNIAQIYLTNVKKFNGR